MFVIARQYIFFFNIIWSDCMVNFPKGTICFIFFYYIWSNCMVNFCNSHKFFFYFNISWSDNMVNFYILIIFKAATKKYKFRTMEKKLPSNVSDTDSAGKSDQDDPNKKGKHKSILVLKIYLFYLKNNI